LVIDDAGGRAQWIPISHNIPGFPGGISGNDYLSLLREQATRYGAVLRPGRVNKLIRLGGLFHAIGEGFEITAPLVILATGVIDITPAVPNLEQAVARGLIRLCPICDGYEARNKAIGVVGSGRRAVSEGKFLASYTKRITLLGTVQDPLSEEAREAAVEAGLPVVDSLAALEVRDQTVAATLGNGETLIFDAVYAAMGNTPRTTLATALGVTCNEAGCIETDDHRRTNVPGVYAIGDVVDELNQVSVAAGHAAVAATDVHNVMRAS
jgi:thioredoxin reductase (NADPH)